MKLLQGLKPFIIAFCIAMAMYFAAFHFIENRRTRQGPWRVTFTIVSNMPTLLVNQTGLGINDFKLYFPGETATNAQVQLVFAKPQEVPFAVPFGQCLFEDTTFQPGTIVLKLFGHEVQLLPRVLTVDKREYAWKPPSMVSLNKGDISRGVP